MKKAIGLSILLLILIWCFTIPLLQFFALGFAILIAIGMVILVLSFIWFIGWLLYS